MFKIGITAKFFIFGAIIFTGLAFFLSYFSNILIHDLLIERAKTFIADFVKLQAENELAPENFTESNYNENIFNNFLKKIKTKEVIRIKIWSKDSKVIFSDDKSIIGKKFPDNAELQEALEGKIEAEVQMPNKTENSDEKESGHLLEIYIPISFNGEKTPVGVIETYYELSGVNILIDRGKTEIAIIIISSLLTLFIFLLIYFHFFIKKPIFRLKAAAEDVAKGNLKKRVEITSKDEIGLLSESFNKMVYELYKNQKELQDSKLTLENRVKEKLGPYDEKIKTLEDKVKNLEIVRDNLEEKLKEFL